jgi:hypothetical protein
LGLPENPDVTIKEFLSSLGPSQDISGPITTPVPNMDMLDIHLTDLDFGEPFFYILTDFLIVKPVYFSTFNTQHQAALLSDPTRGVPCS